MKKSTKHFLFIFCGCSWTFFASDWVKKWNIWHSWFVILDCYYKLFHVCKGLTIYFFDLTWELRGKKKNWDISGLQVQTSRNRRLHPFFSTRITWEEDECLPAWVDRESRVFYFCTTLTLCIKEHCDWRLDLEVSVNASSQFWATCQLNSTCCHNVGLAEGCTSMRSSRYGI